MLGSNIELAYSETEYITTINNAIFVDLNDTQRKTFPEIADWIEANVPGEV